MLNHRRVANLRRSQEELDPFPRGPLYSEGEAVLQVYSNLVDIQGYHGQTDCPSTQQITSSEAFRTPDSSQFLAPVGVLDDVEPMVEVVVTSHSSPAQSQNMLTSSEARADRIASNRGSPAVTSFDDEQVQDHDFDDDEEESSDENTTNPVFSDSEEDQEFQNVMQTPFRDWAEHNRKWIDLYLRRGLEEAVMDDILKTAGIGYKSWKAVVYNICKYAGLSNTVETYAVCPGHMCYVPDPNSNDEAVELSCSVCGRPEPILSDSQCQMKYIPLLPRIRAMVRDESKCHSLFSYSKNWIRKAGWKLDVFDGKLYDRIISNLSTDGDRYDIFIAASTDGFEAFKKGTHDVWPVAAIIHNLQPQLRFKMQNILPFSFVPGSKEPKNLQSFILPLINGITKINSNGGTRMLFPDGRREKVRVHLLWLTADLPALAKVVGLVGHLGKMPCRFCLQPGVYLSSSNHYYYPSSIIRNHPVTSNASSSRSGMEVICDLRDTKNRTEEHSLAVISDLKETYGQSRKELQRDTGIHEDSVLFRLPTMVRYVSIPVDTMHLIYNVSRRMLDEIVASGEEGYALGRSKVEWIDNEISAAGANISSQLGARPRPLSRFKDWKAAEHKDFLLSYSLVMFDGFLEEPFLGGWANFVAIADICFRPTVSDEDIEKVHSSAVEFLHHYEKYYYRYRESRVGLCKYVFHLLKHLGENMKNCGPLINCSQLWVERYIGWIEHRLHAWNLPAESLFKNALHVEACKIFFNQPFLDDDDHDDVLNEQDQVKILGPHESAIDDSTPEALQALENFLIDYFRRKYPGMTRKDACVIVESIQELTISARVKFLCGSEPLIAGSFDVYSPIEGVASRRRANWFVAVEIDETEASVDVYYGRLLQVYSFQVREDVSLQAASEWNSWKNQYKIGLFDWVTGLQVGMHGQVYKNTVLSKAFTAPTLEDLSIIRRLISVVEHVLPFQQRRRSTSGTQMALRAGRRRCYFLDGDLLKDHLLTTGKICQDGVDRNLKRVVSTSA